MTPLPGKSAPDFDMTAFGFPGDNDISSLIPNFDRLPDHVKKNYNMAMQARRSNPNALRPSYNSAPNIGTQGMLPPMVNPGGFSAPMGGFGMGPGFGAPMGPGFGAPQQQQTFMPPPPNAPGGTYYSGPAFGYQGSRTQHSGARRSSQFFY